MTYTHPTTSQIDAHIAEANRMRAAYFATFLRRIFTWNKSTKTAVASGQAA